MSLNPLNELKRRLEDQDIASPKRLCLAKNVIQSHHFPAAPKERIVADWLQLLMLQNKLSGEEIRNVIGWLNIVDEASSELKTKLIQIVAQYLKTNTLQKEDVPSILSFLDNSKLSSQFGVQIEECLYIVSTLLQYLKADDIETNVQLSQSVFNNIIKFYKESKKKLEFVTHLLDGENLETIFSYLETDRSTVIAVCENILFPMNKKSFFGIYLQTLVRKESIDDLIADKGDNIQSVLKVMEALFAFPKGRTVEDAKFISDFIDVFVSCYYGESQLLFAFYVMVSGCLRMEQDYFIPAMTMDPIIFEENSDKIKRIIFLNMLQTVLKNEVDLNVRLTDTLGVKIAKVETKKTFLLFLENLMLSQLKLDKKPDKATFQIIKMALKLDPVLIEHKMNDILPILMTAKKSSLSVIESYTQMLSCLLEILFKLSRGAMFINQIMPMLRNTLEMVDTEQFNLKEKYKVALESAEDSGKIKNKIITGSDIFPEECVALYGKLTSELMFRQNKDLLTSLQGDFKDYCLDPLEVGKIDASTKTLTEVLTAILSNFLYYNKMADHTVSVQVGEDFWSTFRNFEMECLKTFGQAVLKLNSEPELLQSFLKLCLSCAQLKLLNIRYSHTKMDISLLDTASEVFDLSMLLPCLSSEQWMELASKIDDDKAVLLLDEILLVKTIAQQTLQNGNTENNLELLAPTKSHLIKQFYKNFPMVKENEHFSKVLFTDLDKSQLKQVAKLTVKQILNNSNTEVLRHSSITDSRLLLNALVFETVKHICKCLDNSDLVAKAVSQVDFDISAFSNKDMKEVFNQLSVKYDCTVTTTLSDCVEILKQLKIYYLEENYQIVAILMLLAIKKNCQKKLRRNVDHILLGIFELSPNPPDLYKIFSVDFIFSFEDRFMIDLLTLKIKTSNNMLVIKCLVESAVKRVRTESELVKKIVELLLEQLSNADSSNIDFFSDPAFQISCTILPSIVKQKKTITTSAYRSILADLQEKLHKSLLESFKNINFTDKNRTPIEIEGGNTDESMAVSESAMATLNAISAYSLTLSKYCETTDVEESKNLDYLWNGLEYFVSNAIQSIQCAESKRQHVESSIRLLNSVLRYYKKLETHEIFQTKDKLFLQIWNCLKTRLSMTLDDNATKHLNTSSLEDVSVTLKFICELVSVECFATTFAKDLNKLALFESPSKIMKTEENTKSVLTSHKVSKYLWIQILKANIIGPKCVALSKLIYQSSRNLKSYIHQYYEAEHNGVVLKSKKKKLTVEFQEEEDDSEIKIIKVDNPICEIIKSYLETLSEAILASKKGSYDPMIRVFPGILKLAKICMRIINLGMQYLYLLRHDCARNNVNLDYKSLDSTFELEHSVHTIMGLNSLHIKCEVGWQPFCSLFEGSVAVLNSLIMSREQLLEDRWPCFMQCYRSLMLLLCERSATNLKLERAVEERLGELALSMEKLTQSICKHKTHVSKIAAYTVGDLCSTVARFVPCRNVSQRVESITCLLIRVSDTTKASAFLRRGLAATAGHKALTNAYSAYTSYHKYKGNA